MPDENLPAKKKNTARNLIGGNWLALLTLPFALFAFVFALLVFLFEWMPYPRTGSISLQILILLAYTAPLLITGFILIRTFYRLRFLLQSSRRIYSEKNARNI